MSHQVTMLNEGTKYGYCSGCDCHHYSFVQVNKPTKKDPNRKVWICRKRRTKTGQKPLSERKETRKYKGTKCDDLWRKVIHSRGCCEMNGYLIECNGRLEAHHLIKRSNHAVRHNVENGLLVCAAHHFMAENQSYTFNKEVDRRFPGRLEKLEKICMEQRGGKADLDKARIELENYLRGEAA